jgi:hypothetical protein
MRMREREEKEERGGAVEGSQGGSWYSTCTAQPVEQAESE